MNNRILLSSPCYGKVDPEILEDWMGLAYHCGRRMPEYEFFLGIKTKSEQFRARNVIVEAAQQHNCDRILMLDDDMVIDWNKRGPEAYDFLGKLIAHDKDICGVLYHQRGGECLPVLMKRLNEKSYRFLYDTEVLHALQEVDVAGGGCLLIKTRIFDRIPFPYFNPEHEYGTDVQLCRQAQSRGFTVWADTSIEFGHLRNEKTLITSRNRHQFESMDNQGTPGIKRTFIMSELFECLIQDAMEFTKRPTRDELLHSTDAFLTLRRSQRFAQLSDADWYREFPMDRIARQIWYNTENGSKKMVTQFTLTAVNHNKPLRILEFGCGIGVTAFPFAEKGHQVTAVDIRGTGTLEFLKWRTAKHKLPMTFLESEHGEVPELGGLYDVIVAMDCLEHIEDWRSVLHRLAEHLRPEGILFTNNGLFEAIPQDRSPERTQPEHYELHPKDFIIECAKADLMPYTQVSFIKREVPIYA